MKLCKRKDKTRTSLMLRHIFFGRIDVNICDTWCETEPHVYDDDVSFVLKMSNPKRRLVKLYKKLQRSNHRNVGNLSLHWDGKLHEVL